MLASWGEELAEDDAALFEGIAAFLLRSGVPVMFADAIESSSAVWLGNWGISVLEDETKILDQADYPLPPLRTPQLSKSVSFMATEEFRLSYAEYIERNVFISGIAFDAHSAPQLASRAIIGKDFQAEA